MRRVACKARYASQIWRELCEVRCHFSELNGRRTARQLKLVHRARRAHAGTSGEGGAGFRGSGGGCTQRTRTRVHHMSKAFQPLVTGKWRRVRVCSSDCARSCSRAMLVRQKVSCDRRGDLDAGGARPAEKGTPHFLQRRGAGAQARDIHGDRERTIVHEHITTFAGAPRWAPWGTKSARDGSTVMREFDYNLDCRTLDQ